MGSTRLPGKMLADLGGTPILEWVLRRVCQARTIDTVVLATTTLGRDNGLVSLAEQLGVKVFRGSETDVLGRFAAAATQYAADIVVRICADNPFVDPEEVDRLVNYFQSHPCDYACNHQDRLGSRYADGFGAEIFSNTLLQKISKQSDEPAHREHATKYIWDHASEYRLSAVPAPTELAYPHLRFDVDRVEDISYLRTLVDAGVTTSSSAGQIVKIALCYDQRALVTTDIKLEGPLEHSNTYFLGAWCLTSLADEKNAVTAGKILDYHWNDRVKLKNDFAYLHALNEELLEELSSTLNQLHGVNEEIRYWRLLLGFWLNIYTSVIFDRWSSLQQARKFSQRWQVKVPQRDAKVLAAKDTAEFIRLATESNDWNHALFALLATYIPGIELTPSVSEQPIAKIQAPNAGIKKSAGKVVKDAIRTAVGSLKAKDQYFLISTSLSINSLLALELDLGQIPLKHYPFDTFVNAEFDATKRQWGEAATENHKEFDSIARKLLPIFIPRIFLEGFSELNAQAKRVPWAKSPKVIFTSNLHFGDDLFKAWSAQKIANGSRLVIGEHGGMGVGLFNGTHAYELAIADCYLSTGWRDSSNHRIVPIGQFRTQNTVQPNLSGKALMVCGNMPRFALDIRSMTLSSQMLDYFGDQFLFIESLPERIRQRILVRLYPSDYGWRQKERWLERCPETVFDDGARPMLETAGNCRLFIGTYNATTYIEALSVNFPTVIFWNPKHWEIKPESQPYFDRLKDSGIFHETPQSAAYHISNIWDDVSAWWARTDVQCARRSFCDNYAAPADNIVDRIKNALINEARFADNLSSR